MRKSGSGLRRWSRQRVGWTTGLLAVSAVTILSFQNCTQPVPSASEEDQLASQAEKIDFAYDATLDEVAYMSCSNMTIGTYDASAYFTLRTGAYKFGGLTLTDGFFDSMGSRAPERMAALLSKSPANTATIPQVALRALVNYQQVMTASGTAQENQDYMNMLAELGSEEMSTALVNLPVGSRLRYLRDGTPWGARMEANLHFTNNFRLAESVRQFLRNEGFLGLTYTHQNESGVNMPTLARSQADVYNDNTDVRKSVYGYGYKMKFGQPAVTPLYSQFPQVVLKEISEINLESVANRTGLGTWTCPNVMQFRIVRATDLAKPGADCRKIPDPATLTQELSIVRNVLRAEDWWVDMEKRCIIPKKPGQDCYGDFKTVVYTMGDACNTNADNTCVSYASICYRTQ